ncbi:MAG: sodium:solute symporter [Bacteroidota bacterium]
MSPTLILSIIGGYFGLLFVVSLITGRNADEATFFRGNKASPWYLVAFGMIGASLSGVTFISVPGWVGTQQFAYMQMVFGYLAGYIVISRVLMPMYYRMNLTSIYGYLEERYGLAAYRTGAVFFLLSRVIGAAFRLYLVALVLDLFVIDALAVEWGYPDGAPFWLTVAVSILLIWVYTFRGGIKTVVWTDTLQTLAMLLAVGFAVWAIKEEMGLSLGEMVQTVTDSEYSSIFVWDWANVRFFPKQFLSGMFIAIVMTGLDQDMMQKNLTCKTLKDAQKNMETFSVVLIFVNLVFLTLGALLYIYGTQQGLVSMEGDTFMTLSSSGEMVKSGTDILFPYLALNHLPTAIGVLFVLGLIAAAYSSADSALTALTTSFCVDILDFEKKAPDAGRRRTRNLVHVGFSVLLFFVILTFYAINNEAVIAAIFTAAGYTYGPLLGLYAFGLFTKMRPADRLIPVVCIASPILSYLLNLLVGGWFGFAILLVNGGVTFVGLWLLAVLGREEL